MTEQTQPQEEIITTPETDNSIPTSEQLQDQLNTVKQTLQDLQALTGAAAQLDPNTVAIPQSVNIAGEPTGELNALGEPVIGPGRNVTFKMSADVLSAVMRAAGYATAPITGIVNMMHEQVRFMPQALR